MHANGIYDTYGSLFYSQKNCFMPFLLGDIMYFSCTFTWLLRGKKAILIKCSQICESLNTFAPNYKFLASINEAILTRSSLKIYLCHVLLK